MHCSIENGTLLVIDGKVELSYRLTPAKAEVMQRQLEQLKDFPAGGVINIWWEPMKLELQLEKAEIKSLLSSLDLDLKNVIV